jgi:MFS family permease
MLNDALPQIQIALLPVFIKEFELTVFQAGLMVSIPFICSTVSLVFAGLLADRIAHINQMVIALSLMGFSSIMIGLTRGLTILVILLSIILVANSLFHPAGFNLSSKVLKSERRSTALGFFNAGGIMGFAIGPFSVGALLGLFEWRMIYFFWTVIIFADVGYLLTFKLNRKQRAEAYTKTLKVEVEEKSVKPSFRSVLTLPFIALLSFIGLEWVGRYMIVTYLTSFLVYDRSYTVQMASIFLGLISVVGLIGAPLSGFIADRYGVLKWFMVCIGSLIACTYLILVSPFILVLAIVALIYGFFAAGEQVSSTSLIPNYVHINRMGLGYSLFFLSINGVSAIAPLIGGLIAEDYGFSAVFYGAILFMLLALVLTWSTLFRKNRHKTESAINES